MKSVEVMSVECYYSTRVSARNGLKANRRASLAGRTPLPSAQEFHDAYARDSAALTCATTTVAAAAKTVSALRECTPLQCKLAKPGRKQSFSATRACMVGAVRGACPPSSRAPSPSSAAAPEPTFARAACTLQRHSAAQRAKERWSRSAGS